MASLFLVDQSLTHLGGHHYDYMNLVARAADFRGLSPIIATHQDFKSLDALGCLGPVSATFRNTTYSKYSLLAGLREMTRAQKKPAKSAGGLVGWVRSRQARRAKQRTLKARSDLIRQFAEDCDRFFSPHVFDDCDQALFVTMSELDFMGLAAYLSNNPRTLQMTWHIQFHFNLFHGRPSEYDDQSDSELAILECFQSALARIPYHDVRCYTTSQELSDQYNRLRLIPFDCLPYPINPHLFEPSMPTTPRKPLEMTVAGSVRREKGQKSYLANLIDEIWDDQLCNGNLRLNVQCKHRDRRQQNTLLPKRVTHDAAQDQVDQAIHIFGHPLAEQEYLKLIERSDIGLMFYDSRRYYSRRAGILGEYLAAGKPVIVPAGCWLSEQIAESSFQYVEEILASTQIDQRLHVTDTQWSSANVPLAGGIISFDRDRHPFECNWPVSANQGTLAVEFAWHWPTHPGSFCRLQVMFFDESDKPIGQQVRVLGTRRDGAKTVAMFNLPNSTRHIQLGFTNAYLDTSISLAELGLYLLPAGENGPLPISTVGVTVPETNQLPDAVQEIMMHYDHYLTSAVDFAQSWAARHDPIRTIDFLLDNSHEIRRVA